MSLLDFLKGFGTELGTELINSAVNGYTDQTTCPDCGGELHENYSGYLECEDCHEQFAVGDDGILFTENYIDPYDI